RGGHLHGIHYDMPMASAQVKSAILLAGLYASGETLVTEPAKTRDHTELALELFGARVEKRGRTVVIQGMADGPGKGALQPKSLDVPGDISSAVFFIAAASLLPESNLFIANVGLNPTRSAVLDFFQSMGASLTVLNLQSVQGELIGALSVKGAPLKGGHISGELVPLLIDELPMLAALGPFTEEGIEIRDASELRVKESDRIGALAENLREMGAKVEELRWLARGRPPLRQGAWRGNQAARRSSHCHGLRRCRSGRRRRNHYPRCRLRRSLLSPLLR